MVLVTEGFYFLFYTEKRRVYIIYQRLTDLLFKLRGRTVSFGGIQSGLGRDVWTGVYKKGCTRSGLETVVGTGVYGEGETETRNKGGRPYKKGIKK